MASTSSSRGLWDPYRVLKVNPPNTTCVGFAPSTGSRCGWRFNSEKLTTFQTTIAIKSLRSMSEMDPSRIDYPELMVLAQNTLCNWHTGQAESKCEEWLKIIEDYLHKQHQGLAAVSPTRQLKYEVTDAKQLQNGIANGNDTAEQEIKATRLALEKVKAELEKSETRCSGLIDKNSKLDREREENQAANSRNIASLSQQLTDSRNWARTLEQQKVDEAERLRKQMANEKTEEVERLKKQLAAEKTEEVEQLKKQMAGRNANFMKDVAAKSTENARLNARVKELEGYNQKYIESKGENAAQMSRLQEQDRKVELLAKQMEAVSRELEEREDELSSLQPRNVKRGLFVVISWRPPRIVVRKMSSKVMRTEKARYVQSVA